MKFSDVELKKVKYSGIDGLTKISWHTHPGSFVTASQTGVMILAEVHLEDHQDLQAYAKFISDAWKEHRKLVPKLTKDMAGHIPADEC